MMDWHRRPLPAKQKRSSVTRNVFETQPKRSKRPNFEPAQIEKTCFLKNH
jgi:hypothetical protein